MEPIQPMEPLASDAIPTTDDWVAQIKWDGVRILTYYDGKYTRLFNRKKHERTMNYPELLDSQAFCQADSVILDGEMIALGTDGKPSFHEVMRRDGIRRAEKVRLAREQVPVTYMIFDVVYFNGMWVNDKTFAEREEILSSIIQPSETIQLVRSYEDGEALFDAVKGRGMEGVVMKRRSSPYLLGQKKEWLKVKYYRDLIAPIGGFTLSGGVINAILLGLYDGKGQFHYIGHSGTGKLSANEWRMLTDFLKPKVIQEKPFINRPERERGAYWVNPEITVKVKYAEWTEGRSLRQPTIEGFVQMDPKECFFAEEMKR